MSVNIMLCDIYKCMNKIHYDGALLFSPLNENDQCHKIHICKEHYDRIFNTLITNKKPDPLIVKKWRVGGKYI